MFGDPEEFRERSESALPPSLRVESSAAEEAAAASNGDETEEAKRQAQVEHRWTVNGLPVAAQRQMHALLDDAVEQINRELETCELGLLGDSVLADNILEYIASMSTLSCIKGS